MKVFLGGTCNNSTWRDELIPLLKIDYFNPVVDDWTSECQKEELKQRTECDIILYVITKEMKGVYSIAEVIDDSNKRPYRTVLCILHDGFDTSQVKSLNAVENMAKLNGVTICKDIADVTNVLNNLKIDDVILSIDDTHKGISMLYRDVMSNPFILDQNVNLRHVPLIIKSFKKEVDALSEEERIRIVATYAV